PCVEPSFNGPAAGEPQDALIVEIEVVGAKACVDGDDLFRLGVVHLQLPSALVDRKRFGGRVARTLTTERYSLAGADARGNPHASVTVHCKAVRRRLCRPD